MKDAPRTPPVKVDQEASLNVVSTQKNATALIEFFDVLTLLLFKDAAQ